MKHRILSLVTLLSSFSFILAPIALAPLVISCSSGDLKDSDSAEAAFKEAEEFDKDERYEEAVTKYSEVKNKFPYSKLATEAELRIADVNYKKEAYIESATSYQLFKDFHPKHPRIDYATFRLGMSYYNQLDTVDRDLSPATKAIQAFDEVITSYSTSQYLAEAKEKKAKSIQMLSDKEAYIANFYFIRDHFEAALKRYNSLLAKYAGTGHDEEALYRAGFSAFEMNDNTQAQEKLKTLIEKYPNSDYNLERAHFWRNMAAVDIQEMLSLAREKFKASENASAEKLLTQIILLDNNIPEVFHMLGSIYYDQSKFTKAINSFKRAIEIDPTFTDASVGLSIIYNDLGKYDEGRAVFEKAQKELADKRTAGDPFVEEKLAAKHLELGDLYFQYLRYDEAAEQYYKCLALTSRKPDAHMKIVEVLLRKNSGSKAVKELRKVTANYPAYIPARLKLGVTYYNSNRVVEAIQEWESVLMRDPQNPDATNYLRLAQEIGVTSI